MLNVEQFITLLPGHIEQYLDEIIIFKKLVKNTGKTTNEIFKLPVCPTIVTLQAVRVKKINKVTCFYIDLEV